MASRRTAVLVYRWSKVYCHRLRSVWTLPVVTTTDEWGWGGWRKWRKLEFAQAGLFYGLNWRENRSKNKLVCEHAVAWLGTRELLLSGKLRLVKLFWFLHQSPKCTKSMYLFPSRGIRTWFFCLLIWNAASKKCEGCIAGVFIEMCARTVNMEKVWL